MKSRMIVWLAVLLSFLMVACREGNKPAPEPEAVAEPATVQFEASTESSNEVPDFEVEQIRVLAPDFTLLDGNGYMVNLGAISWRNPNSDSNMVNLGAIIWRITDKQINQRRDISTAAVD